MKVGRLVFLQCDETVVGCVIAAVYFAHKCGHNLGFALVVFKSDLGIGVGQYLDINFIIVHDEDMSQCLLVGRSGSGAAWVSRRAHCFV